MSQLKSEVDMTTCIYQPVNDWIKCVRKKDGDTIANKCAELIGEGTVHEKMLSELNMSPSEIIKLAIICVNSNTTGRLVPPSNRLCG